MRGNFFATAATALLTSLPLSSCAFFESITASGLIGNHFGAPGFNATFDYVVIGGGTAGLAIATRLAENSKFTVAVIEAGGFYEMDSTNHSEIPADAGFYLGTAPLEKNPLIDWQQYTTPQPGLNNKKLFYTRGKTFGGSSARNFMAYQRGTKGSYQKWADEVDDQSYTWSALLPFFKKSITFDPPHNSIRASNSSPSYDLNSFSSSGGPVHVSFPNWANPFSSWVAIGFEQLGLKQLAGFVSGELLGHSYLTLSIDGESQTRSSSETGFLRKALRELVNLTLYKTTLGKRVLFDDNKKATGVVVETAGMEYVLSANKEVILSSGVFRSPQLLMVSGIGPKETLEKFNIPVLADRPGVGQNMWDHLLFSVAHEVNVETHSALGNPTYMATQIDLYNTNRTGMLTNSADDMLGWEKLPKSSRTKLSKSAQEALAEFPADWPEIEFLLDDEFVGSTSDLLDAAPTDGKSYASIAVAVITPLSRGNVTILSNDTSINPAVSPNFLVDPRDQEVAIQAFKRSRALWATPALQKVSIGEEAFPGKNVTTDEEILENIKNNSLEVYHASATNKMGRRDDPMAVVDSKARVIGVDGLRVVDISAFPFLPPGHPQATVYCLAEKIAHDILAGEAAKQESKEEMDNSNAQKPLGLWHSEL